MIRTYEIILNPTAGKGKAEKEIPEITDFFEAKSLPYRIHTTEYPGHAAELAASLVASSSESAIIAAGGDGTCNEVINGLLGSGEKILPLFGVLPIGRGNDFAFGAGLPANLAEALSLFIEPKAEQIDIGLLKGGNYQSGRYFGNGVGIGFDTLVGLEAAKMKHIHGAAGYMIGALKTLITFSEAPELELSYAEETIRCRPALVSIMNGTRMGGAFYMAPNGIINDGLLSVCRTDQGPRMKLLKAMLHYMKGTQETLNDTTIISTEKISIRAISGVMAVHADGETICTDGTALEIECVGGALQLIRGRK